MTTLPDTQSVAKAKTNGPGDQFRVVLEPFSPGVLSVGFESPTPFRAAALLWHGAGWPGVIPLPAQAKFPPPTGYTGSSGAWPTAEQVARWASSSPSSNVALRLGNCVTVRNHRFQVIGLDVDAYADAGKTPKSGAAQLEALEKRLGPLPDTWVSSSRADGVSGIRFYLVPTGLMLAQEAARHIEVIQAHHRYAVVYPSIHPGGSSYRLYPPGRLPDGLSYVDEIFTPQQLPLLPDDWVKDLTLRASSTTSEASKPVTAQQITRFAAQHTQNSRPKALDGILKDYRQKLDAGADGTRNPTFAALCWAAKVTRLGYFPWNDALAQIEALAREHYAQRSKLFDVRAFQRDSRDAIRIGLAADLKAVEEKENRDFGDKRAKNKELTDSYYAAGNQRYRKMNTAKIEQNNGAELDEDFDFDSVDADESVVQSLAEIKPQAVRWLWKGWIPFGKLTIFEGESEVGKSTVTISWAATVSSGRAWPTAVVDGKSLVSQHKPSGVLLVGIEDSAADTVVPRLIAAKADRSKIYRLNMSTDSDGNPVPFTIDDMSRLRTAIKQSKASLVIIDPITAFLPEGVQHNVDASVRKALMPVVQLADETGSAIVAIRHFNKNTKASAKDRGGGSVAYSALARMVIQAGKLPEVADDGATHALALAIDNIAKKPDAIGYCIYDAPDSSELPAPEDEALKIGALKWCGPVSMTADELATPSDERKRATLREQAKDQLEKILLDGEPHPSGKVIELVKLATACSEKTVDLAARELAVVREKVYENGKVDHWTWRLDLFDEH